MIDALYIFISFFAPFEVGDGFYFARSHFHKYASAPFSTRLHAHLLEFLLHDVLQGDVDGGGDVVARNGRFFHHSSHTGGHLYVLSHAGFAVKERVESHFQAATTVDLSVFAFAYVAYASSSHGTIGLSAHPNGA